MTGNTTPPPKTPTVTKHKNLATAKLAFQGDIKSIEKNSSVSFGNTGYDYVDLAGILDYVLPILSKHGLLLEQFNTERDINHTRTAADGATEGHYAKTLAGIRTVLTHAESGEMQENLLYDSSEIKDIKGRGAAITYLRRYSVLTVLGLSAEDDDAGSGGTKKPAKTPDPEKKPAAKPGKDAPPGKRTDEEIQAEFKELGLDTAEVKAALTAVNIKNMGEAIVLRKKYQTTKEMLEAIAPAPEPEGPNG